jgi:endoglucanase
MLINYRQRHHFRSIPFHYVAFGLAVLALLIAFKAVGLCQVDRTALPTVFLAGVNLAGAEFGSVAKNGPLGRHTKDYVYPVASLWPGYASPNYFIAKGMNTFRLPLSWERLQPNLMGALNETEAKLLVIATSDLLKLGAWVIIDLHNYARYYGEVLGSNAVGYSSFADVWRRIALLFKHRERVIFGLMNEPHDLPTENWVDAANEAIRAIRGVEARNLILVSGNHWGSAQSMVF